MNTTKNSPAYPNLFTPLTIGNITIRNRLMQTAHAKGFHAADGLTNNRDIYYQAERAKGGIGLIVTGARMRKAIREVREDVPMFIVGHIVDASKAEELVASGATDMVAMTRTQIADPAFANKVQEGREDEINHCIRCNQGCIARLMVGNAISCVVNPAAGREQVFGAHTLQFALKPARWLVVGGGPAGMKAALTLQQCQQR